MKNYNLLENETILYRGSVTVMPDGKENDHDAPRSELLLTNLNIVVSSQKKKFLKTATETEVYSIEDVKVYEEEIQIKRKKTAVDVYLKTGELFLGFENEKEARLFCNCALKLISGESKFVRSVKRVRKEIKETDEALDINIEGMVATGAAIAASAVVGAASLEGAGKKTKVIGKIAETLLTTKKRGDTKSLPEPNEET